MVGFNYSVDSVYERDYAFLKTYRSNCHKVALIRRCRLAGFEEQGVCKGKRNSAGHAEKLDSSLSRTRSRIFELAMCNDWEYFVTLTLSPEHGNRKDLRTFKRSLSKWLNNLNTRRGCCIQYLLIPEAHADGSWHMHGLFMGIPEDLLRPFSPDEHLPYRVLSMLAEGRQLFDWPAYAEKFGYVTCERIHDLEACAKYITKYISKDLGENAARLNEKLYLCSHGLKRAKVLRRGHIVRPFVPDFCNDYVATKTFSDVEEALSLFEDSNISDLVPVGFFDIASQWLGGEPIRKPCLQT